MEGLGILEVFSLSSTSSTLQLKDNSVYQGGERLFFSVSAVAKQSEKCKSR